MTAEELAILFHATYERLAPSFGYETREETRTFNPDSANGKLMIAVCDAVLGPIYADMADAKRDSARMELEHKKPIKLWAIHVDMETREELVKWMALRGWRPIEDEATS